MAIHIAIAEESTFSADLVRFSLARASDIQVVGSGARVEGIAPHLHHCDVLLVNLRLADSGALRLMRSVNEAGLPVRVILRGGHMPAHELIPYFELGARGYLDSESSIDDLLDAVRAAYAGHAIVPPQIGSMLISRLTQLAQVSRTLLPDAGDPLPGLTPRQLEVLTLVARGHSNQEIADQLFIEVGTVKNHIHNLLDKLNARDRHEAATIAARTGLIMPQKTPAMSLSDAQELLTAAV